MEEIASVMNAPEGAKKNTSRYTCTLYCWMYANKHAIYI